MAVQTRRPDIQGLRAVAVAVVVAFHAGVPGLDGGFVGVDVFFVVSGYVIMASLLREHEATGRVDLLGFYGRRVRRLVPALVAMLIVVLPLCVLFLEVGQAQTEAAATAVAAMFSVANLRLLATGDAYFAAGGHANPFVHAWSLGIEEQFYLAAPLLALALGAAGRTRWRGRTIVGMLVLATAVASFAYAVSEVSRGREHSAFYSPASRFWEIAVGVALAALPLATRRLAWLPCAAAFVALAASVVVYDSETTFPGVTALLPVAASGLLVRYALGAPKLTSWLGASWLVWIGDRSYGLYLWHWPMIVLARHGLGLGWIAASIASVVALIPASLSYRYLEAGVVGQARVRSRPRLGPVLLLATAGLVVVAESGVLQFGADRAWGLEVEARVPDGIAYTSGCHSAARIDIERCTFGPKDADGTVVLIGDSHAASLADGVIEASGRLHLQVVTITANSCPFVLVPPDSACADDRELAWEAIMRLRPTLVVVTQNSAMYLIGRYMSRLADDSGRAPETSEQASAIWEQALARTLEETTRVGSELVVVETVPVFPPDRRGPTLLDPGSPPTRGVEEFSPFRAIAVEAERRGLGGGGHSVDPLPILCPGGTCSQVSPTGEWLYFDPSHLNRAGSLTLSDLLAASLRERVDEQMGRVSGSRW